MIEQPDSTESTDVDTSDTSKDALPTELMPADAPSLSAEPAFDAAHFLKRVSSAPGIYQMYDHAGKIL